MDTTSDVIEPENSEHHRAKVRRELSESLDKYGGSKTVSGCLKRTALGICFFLRQIISHLTDATICLNQAAIPAASSSLGAEKNANRDRSGAKDRNNSLDSPPLGVAPSSMDVSEEGNIVVSFLSL
jgi:hypothetical protein